MLRFDLHVHSNFSKDGTSSIESILKAAKAKGLDGIAITDHDTTKGAKYALEICEKVAPGLIVIPGEEISTKSGHMIVLGITETIPPGLSVKDTIVRARELGGTIIIPHPGHRMRHGMNVPRGIDAVEIFNSRYIVGYHNYMARRRAHRKSVPGVAGSDAHTADLVGTAVTEVNTHERDAGSVLKAIREGKTRVVVKKTPLIKYMAQIGRGWVRKIKYKMGGREKKFSKM
ncbi:metal-dependent phosphoesterase [Methanocella sp. CWC-04]|uniref:Metal-dependent phosphoesterase n=1 Tax=Methanooceanicella nereidis TaxID=2052831 RepID=A0AAP2RDV9_9EURY|nr:PHP domain-containing protein [Methanocella sp. CWC-04]MCD1294392.1 metal-dependent phosphoesterase [Methanocella sp. CWC-04]